MVFSDNREVAVVAFADYVGYEECHTVMRSITDWTEVTKEEHVALSIYVDRVKPLGDMFYKVIQKVPTDQMPTLISECLAEAKKYQAQQEKEKEEREKKRKARALEKEKQKLKEKKKLLEELKAELGEA